MARCLCSGFLDGQERESFLPKGARFPKGVLLEGGKICRQEIEGVLPEGVPRVSYLKVSRYVDRRVSQGCHT